MVWILILFTCLKEDVANSKISIGDLGEVIDQVSRQGRLATPRVGSQPEARC
jgi:hypothetical protein